MSSTVSPIPNITHMQAIDVTLAYIYGLINFKKRKNGTPVYRSAYDASKKMLNCLGVSGGGISFFKIKKNGSFIKIARSESINDVFETYFNLKKWLESATLDEKKKFFEIIFKYVVSQGGYLSVSARTNLWKAYKKNLNIEGDSVTFDLNGFANSLNVNIGDSFDYEVVLEKRKSKMDSKNSVDLDNMLTTILQNTEGDTNAVEDPETVQNEKNTEGDTNAVEDPETVQNEKNTEGDTNEITFVRQVEKNLQEKFRQLSSVDMGTISSEYDGFVSSLSGNYLNKLVYYSEKFSSIVLSGVDLYTLDDYYYGLRYTILSSYYLDARPLYWKYFYLPIPIPTSENTMFDPNLYYNFFNYFQDAFEYYTYNSNTGGISKYPITDKVKYLTGSIQTLYAHFDPNGEIFLRVYNSQRGDFLNNPNINRFVSEALKSSTYSDNPNEIVNALVECASSPLANTSLPAIKNYLDEVVKNKKEEIISDPDYIDNHILNNAVAISLPFIYAYEILLHYLPNRGISSKYKDSNGETYEIALKKVDRDGRQLLQFTVSKTNNGGDVTHQYTYLLRTVYDLAKILNILFDGDNNSFGVLFKKLFTLKSNNIEITSGDHLKKIYYVIKTWSY